MKKTVKLSVHETVLWQKLLWIASQMCDMKVVTELWLGEQRTKVESPEMLSRPVVPTDLIVRADAHFVGAEPRNVRDTSQRELRASQNNERTTSL